MNTPATRPASIMGGARIRLDCGLTGTVHQLWRNAVDRGATICERSFAARIKRGLRDMGKLIEPARKYAAPKKDDAELAEAIAAVRARRLTGK